jgi:ribosome-binding factor A
MDKLKKTEIDFQREISSIINSKVKDPRVGFVTITGVKLSPDFHYMDVYFTLLDERRDLKLCLSGLNTSKGFIKKNIQERIRIKTMPEIKFIYDKSIENGLRISRIIEQLKKKEENI